MRFGDLGNDFKGLLDRGSVADSNEDFLPDVTVGEGPVHHGALKDNAVRNEDFDAVGATELRATGAD